MIEFLRKTLNDAVSLYVFTLIFPQYFYAFLGIFINLLQKFQHFWERSVLTTLFIWLRPVCKKQIPNGTATRVSHFTR